MSWFDNLFRKRPKTIHFAPTFDGYTPIFSQFGTDIYASDVVQQALKCIVDEMKKLNPTHVRYTGSDPVPVKDSVQNVLDDPNPLMTTSELLEKTVWLLLLNYNAFLIPTYYTWVDKQTGAERRVYDGLYPVNPSQVDFVEDAAGRLYVHMAFRNNYETTIAYEDVIHVKCNYSVNEYMGGNEYGQPDHTALLKTLELNNSLLQGVAKAMNASYAVNGVVKYNTMIDQGKTEAALKELETHLRNSESGFLPLDIKGDFIPLERKLELVDKDTLEFIDAKILRNWGVPLAILTGDYTKEQYEAFYQKTLEPLIIAMSQAFTKKLFTPREKAYGNKIQLYPKDLIFMTMEQTIEMAKILGDRGGAYTNEIRSWFGLRPLPELEGQIKVSLNYVDADIANEYQMGKYAKMKSDSTDNAKNADAGKNDEEDEDDGTTTEQE